MPLNPSSVLYDDSVGTPVTVTTATPLPVTTTPSAGVATTDKSGTVTAGATAQVLAAANASRRGYWVQNQSSADLWVSSVGTAAATQPSLKIPAGALYESPAGGCPVSALSIFGATTGQAFAAREW